MIHINQEYLDLLKIMASLSGLFSDNKIPYLYYRNAENLFCYALKAKNLSRDDSAFDALLVSQNQKIGVGLKTFICQNWQSMEKVAEFNQLSSTIFQGLSGQKLVEAVADARNKRIDFATNLYGTDKAIYHLVTRREGELRIFEEEYPKIDIQNLTILKQSNTGISFDDGLNEYNYNFSKSTLFKRFYVKKPVNIVPVEIIQEPYELLLALNNYTKKMQVATPQSVGFVILPLYSVRGLNKEVPPKSGLNQWNAGGRARSYNEVYIPVPKKIQDKYGTFFPSRDIPFQLKTPDGKVLNAKICQDGGKALMTNPNSALADWLLRSLLSLSEGELATFEHLQAVDCDSVVVRKYADGTYSIDKAPFDSYTKFIDNDLIFE